MWNQALKRRMSVLVSVVVVSLLCVAVALAADLTDTTRANFSAGTVGSCFVSPSAADANADGELILTPDVFESFDATWPLSGWGGQTWSVGVGSIAISGGQLIVDNAVAYTSATYGPGSVLDFVATFASTHSQHAGFFNVVPDDLFTPWAMFSTGNGGLLAQGLYARSNGTFSAIANAAAYLDAPHRYRIEWAASQIVYSIDGEVVATHSVSLSGTAPIGGSDNQSAVLPIDWMRIGPYAPTTCAFNSRVMDGGVADITWETMNVTQTLPVNTSVVYEVRADNVDPTGAAYTAFTPPNIPIGAVQGRYVQYRLTLSTSAVGVTPAIERVSLSGESPTAVTLLNLAAGATKPGATLWLALGAIGVGLIAAVALRRRK